jgi:transcriptional regulator with XRE-family HTH domain
MIGNRIKELRLSLEMNQTEFAKSIGIGQSAISHIEKGDNPPEEQTIILICKIHNVNRVWLETGKGEIFIESSPYIDLQHMPLRTINPQHIKETILRRTNHYIKSPHEGIIDKVLDVLSSQNNALKESLNAFVNSIHGQIETQKPMRNESQIDINAEIEKFKLPKDRLNTIDDIIWANQNAENKIVSPLEDNQYNSVKGTVKYYDENTQTLVEIKKRSISYAEVDKDESEDIPGGILMDYIKKTSGGKHRGKK